jgi:hypothetical protein
LEISVVRLGLREDLTSNITFNLIISLIAAPLKKENGLGGFRVEFGKRVFPHHLVL